MRRMSPQEQFAYATANALIDMHALRLKRLENDDKDFSLVEAAGYGGFTPAWRADSMYAYLLCQINLAEETIKQIREGNFTPPKPVDTLSSVEFILGEPLVHFIPNLIKAA